MSERLQLSLLQSASSRHPWPAGWLQVPLQASLQQAPLPSHDWPFGRQPPLVPPVEPAGVPVLLPVEVPAAESLRVVPVELPPVEMSPAVDPAEVPVTAVPEPAPELGPPVGPAGERPVEPAMVVSWQAPSIVPRQMAAKGFMKVKHSARLAGATSIGRSP